MAKKAKMDPVIEAVIKAKREVAPRKVDLVAVAERAIRDALHQSIGSIAHEGAYVDTALSALDLVIEGLGMRKQELESEAE